MALVTEIIEILVSGIGGIAEGVGGGLTTLVNQIFLTTEGKLSAFGTVTVVFAAIALAIGLCRLVVRWISSLGGSNV